MYRRWACSNDSGAAAGCCASSRLHGESLQWSDGTCGPCPGRGSSFLQMSGHASLCACAQPLWSIGCLGCVWQPCGRGRLESPQRTCRWRPHPPSKSWAPSGLRSDDQHAPKKWYSNHWLKKKKVVWQHIYKQNTFVGSICGSTKFDKHTSIWKNPQKIGVYMINLVAKSNISIKAAHIGLTIPEMLLKCLSSPTDRAENTCHGFNPQTTAVQYLC